MKHNNYNPEILHSALSLCSVNDSEIDKQKTGVIAESEALLARRNNRRRTERAIIREISLITAVFTIVIMAIMAAYQLRATQHDLAYDLTVVFSNCRK
ncbi:MAG: hypothetical protein HQL08_07490 [Nitrospirae bacterium]|nr:hypothetical protein [Nitrospirota bacterium]